MTIRVLVCGGRDFQDHKAVFAELDRLNEARGVDLVIHGACVQRGMLSGADRWAEEWAKARETPYLGFPARWNAEGNAAGPKRNARMLERCKPHVVVAFPGGRGTRGMAKLARDAGVEVIEIVPSGLITG
ncbi:hypothetical protein TSH7_01165 [Azospirillum sp. TSH7]|uniref:DUF2493 domain-containing protein n=1 Tax=unclassified Azospirillum TaxID=2630922 RepID=UPI000D608693|nr:MULTISPECIES: DUF2493 domain-containing protein [unclassified Azospirillum]PWC69085.1 hypothetical protein TSH7_01165 [Azospirillum sp. TSH7]PWC71423.1 hypothetical protein TSH20_03910 [Azospirillum sp. TSH20]